MKSEIPDIQLFNAFRSGDDAAFSRLYRQYAPQLIDYAAHKLESLDEARDIIHDLFVYVWEKRQQIEITQSVKGYLFLALNRRIINHYRQNSYHTRYANQLKAMESEYYFGPDSFVEAKDVQQIVSDSLHHMPKRVREIYLLSREEHLTNAEIAKHLDISEQTVKNQLSAALAILRKSMKRIALLALIALFCCL